MNLEPAFPGNSTQPPIQRYGGGGFRLGGSDYAGSILLTPDGVENWTTGDISRIVMADLLTRVGAYREHMLLVGCGARFVPPPMDFYIETKKAGLVPEWMDTGSACRTYNVLLSEDRLVVAALIALNPGSDAERAAAAAG